MTKLTAAWIGFFIAPLIASVVLALGSPAMTQGTATGYVATVGLLYVAGAAAALGFWLIWRSGRDPDQ